MLNHFQDGLHICAIERDHCEDLSCSARWALPFLLFVLVNLSRFRRVRLCWWNDVSLGSCLRKVALLMISIVECLALLLDRTTLEK